MSRHRLYLVAGALSALLLSGLAGAASLPLKNGGFEEWDVLQPKHWGGAQLAAGAMDTARQSPAGSTNGSGHRHRAHHATRIADRDPL